MTISLPEDADGLDYEDQVCAILQALGYYIEARLILKAGAAEVLEFDALATPVNDYSNRRVVEIKSGKKWGLSDVFKLYGQITYTSENSGWLIHKKKLDDKKKSAISEVAQEIPISTINVDLNSDHTPDDIPSGLEVSDDWAHRVYLTSWWSRSANRHAQSKFKSWCSSQEGSPEEIESAKSYLEWLDGYIFKKTPLSRVDSIYEAYRNAPKLSSTLQGYVVNNSKWTRDQVFQGVFNGRGEFANRGASYAIQYVATQEWRARIAIIKNAYDTILHEANKPHSESGAEIWESVINKFMPATFRGGMEALHGYPEPEKVPYFFQVFVEVFGGFYFPDDVDEVSALAEATGVAPDNINGAFGLLDEFFPIKKGWVFENGGFAFLKGVPAYLRGAGSFFRTNVYGKGWSETVSDKAWNVTNWHNSMYSLLEPSLKKHPE